MGDRRLVDQALPRGRYELEFTSPGRAPVRVPFHVLRGRPADDLPPGEERPRPLYLPRQDELGDGDCYVPAGWFTAGADRQAADPFPETRVWLEGFVLRRHPVSYAEYLEFLNHLLDLGTDPDDLDRHTSWHPEATPSQSAVDALLRPRADRYEVAEEHRELPVVGVTWHGARAYAAWRAAREGLPWRLPYSLEREKAALGVDGRALPWGDFFDPTWANTATSRTGAPSPCGPEEFPVDESPYGVRHLVGNVRDWCLDAYERQGGAVVDGLPTLEPAADDDPGYRLVRGGTFSAAPHYCRPASRFAALPHRRYLVVGFRLARDLPVRPPRPR